MASLTDRSVPVMREWRANGRGVVVTGAASGIGRAIALRFVANGDKVAGFDIDGDAMADMGLDGAIVCDVADSGAVQQSLHRAAQALGQVDVLVSCAGFAILGQIPDLDERDWHRILSVNVGGAFLIAKYGIPMLRQAGGGAIINIASQLAFVAAPGMAAYCASKGALVQLTRALALDHAREGIRVNAICPGPTDTPAIRAAFGSMPDPVSARSQFASRTAMNRLLEPEEIAGSALFLASRDAMGITGETLTVDAGYLIF